MPIIHGGGGHGKCVYVYGSVHKVGLEEKSVGIWDSFRKTCIQWLSREGWRTLICLCTPAGCVSVLNTLPMQLRLCPSHCCPCC